MAAPTAAQLAGKTKEQAWAQYHGGASPSEMAKRAEAIGMAKLAKNKVTDYIDWDEQGRIYSIPKSKASDPNPYKFGKILGTFTGDLNIKPPSGGNALLVDNRLTEEKRKSLISDEATRTKNALDVQAKAPSISDEDYRTAWNKQAQEKKISDSDQTKLDAEKLFRENNPTMWRTGATGEKIWDYSSMDDPNAQIDPETKRQQGIRESEKAAAEKAAAEKEAAEAERIRLEKEAEEIPDPTHEEDIEFPEEKEEEKADDPPTEGPWTDRGFISQEEQDLARQHGFMRGQEWTNLASSEGYENTPEGRSSFVKAMSNYWDSENQSWMKGYDPTTRTWDSSFGDDPAGEPEVDPPDKGADERAAKEAAAKKENEEREAAEQEEFSGLTGTFEELSKQWEDEKKKADQEASEEGGGARAHVLTEVEGLGFKSHKAFRYYNYQLKLAGIDVEEFWAAKGYDSSRLAQNRIGGPKEPDPDNTARFINNLTPEQIDKIRALGQGFGVALDIDREEGDDVGGGGVEEGDDSGTSPVLPEDKERFLHGEEEGDDVGGGGVEGGWGQGTDNIIPGTPEGDKMLGSLGISPDKVREWFSRIKDSTVPDPSNDAEYQRWMAVRQQRFPGDKDRTYNQFDSGNLMGQLDPNYKYPPPFSQLEPADVTDSPAFKNRLEHLEKTVRRQMKSLGRGNSFFSASVLAEATGKLISQTEAELFNRNLQLNSKQFERAFRLGERDYGRDVFTEERGYKRGVYGEERDYGRGVYREEQNYKRAFAEDARQYQRVLNITNMGFKSAMAQGNLSASLGANIASILERAGMFGANMINGGGQQSARFISGASGIPWKVMELLEKLRPGMFSGKGSGSGLGQGTVTYDGPESKNALNNTGNNTGVPPRNTGGPKDDLL